MPRLGSSQILYTFYVNILKPLETYQQATGAEKCTLMLPVYP